MPGIYSHAVSWVRKKWKITRVDGFLHGFRILLTFLCICKLRYSLLRVGKVALEKLSLKIQIGNWINFYFSGINFLQHFFTLL